MSTSDNGSLDAAATPMPPARTGAEHHGLRLSALDWRVVVGAAFAIALGLGLWAFVRYFAMPLALLVLSITIADALSPIVDWLDRWLPRVLAVSLVFLAMFALFAAAGILVAPRLVDQAQQLLARAPQFMQTTQHWLAAHNVVTADQLSQLAPTWVARLGGFALTLPLRLASAGFALLVMFFLALYWLVAGPSLTAFVESLVPAARQAELTALRNDVRRAMGGYVRGAAIDALITGTMAGVALFAFGIGFPVLLGVLTAFGEMVPVVGPIAVGIPATGVGLMESPTKGLIALLVYTAILQIEGHVIAPNVMGRQAHISQALVIFAFFAGGAVGGLIGAIAAIPLAGAAKVVIVRLIAPAVRRWSGAADIVIANPGPS